MKQGCKIIIYRIFFNKFDKMLMVGYQGWFSAKGDSANIGWYKGMNDGINYILNKK